MISTSVNGCRSRGWSVAGVGVLLLVLGLLSGPAAAHTALLQASPGSGQVAGGQIDFLDLVFLEPVTEVDINVTGPDRELVPGSMVNTEGQIIRYQMAPLTLPGRYIVRYTMTSFDGDFTDSGHFFEYDPSALPPVRLGERDIPPTPLFTVQRIAIGVLGACLAGLVAIQLVTLRRKRRLLAAQRARSGV